MADEIKKIPGLTEALKSVQKAAGALPPEPGQFAKAFETAMSEITPKSADLPDGLQRAGGVQPSETGFGNVLGNLVQDVDRLHKTAEAATEKLVTGQLEDVHQVVIAMEEAQTSFRLLMEVRNKMVEAYREVMKMQI